MADITIRPTDNRVLVERIVQPEEERIGLIWIPEIAQKQVGKLESLDGWYDTGVSAGGENFLTGKVLAVGPGRRAKKGARIPCDVKIGDKVMFSGRWNDWPHLPPNQALITEADIAGIITD